MSSKSFFTSKIEDKKAVYFTDNNFDVKNDGTKDISDELQNAICRIENQYGYGVLFIPEGKYLLSKTIYIPRGIRIIGYGESRPKFILQDNAMDFDKEDKNIKGGFRYLFWFVNEYHEEMTDRYDSHPGTFYSGMSNVDIDLGEGNDFAVALRTHYAQNCYISHIDIDVNSAMAGIFDVGNFAYDLTITGGQYGIISTKCSPGWPFVMTDVRFLGQTMAAIKSREVGFSIIRAYARNTTKFIDVEENYFEKIYIENSIFEDMNCVIDASMDNNSLTQINVCNCYLKSVESIVHYKDTDRAIANEDYSCKLKKYTHGVTSSDEFPEKQVHDRIYRYAMEVDYSILENSEFDLPDSSKWANALDLGLVGDGKSDNSDAIETAMKKNDFIYFPQGEYIFTRPIEMRKNTAFIGLNPAGTKLTVFDNTEYFTGFGGAIPFIKTKKNNIISGLSIDTGGRNPRANAIEWCANDGLMDDVKFVGGHGFVVEGSTINQRPYGPGRMTDAFIDREWDYQYPSLTITGGGTFRNIWSASPYASCGIEIKDTDEKIRMYAISLEHHMRCELRMTNVSNAFLCGIQFEEEKAEGIHIVPVEISNCKDITFATVYCFRTVFVDTPLEYFAKVYNCKNIRFYNVHNFSQMKYTISSFLLDVNSGIEIRVHQAALVEVSGETGAKAAYIDQVLDSRIATKLYDGFRFADGGFANRKGDFYFLDSLNKRVYKIDGETLELSIEFESPFKINALGFDTEDCLIIAGEYKNPIGTTKNGKEIEVKRPEDSYGSSFHGWYNHRIEPVVFAVRDRKIVELKKVKLGKAKFERVLYPGNRWRDGNDVAIVLQYNPEAAYIAPDKKTLIPCHFDLIRATNLAKSKPDRHLYSVDEMYNRVYQCDVNKDGLLENPKVIVEEGYYCVRKHNDYLYIGDDNIKEYENGKLNRVINIPKRPLTFDFGGPNKNIMFVTTQSAVYGIRI